MTNPLGGVYPGTVANDWHSWTDLAAKYLHKVPQSNYYDTATVRRNSVIWGCPEWTKSNDFTSNLPVYDGENVYTGYGMQYYPTYWEDKNIWTMAHFRAGTAAHPQPSYGFVKASTWQRRSSAERGAIADGRWDIITVQDNNYDNDSKYWPHDTIVASPTPTPNAIAIESRHTKPGASKKTTQSSKGINMLFADLHVAPVTPKEAWESIRKYK